MPRGGKRIAGPGKKIGRPKVAVRKQSKSIHLHPEQWAQLHALRPDESLAKCIGVLLEINQKYNKLVNEVRRLKQIQ